MGNCRKNRGGSAAEALADAIAPRSGGIDAEDTEIRSKHHFGLGLVTPERVPVVLGAGDLDGVGITFLRNDDCPHFGAVRLLQFHVALREDARVREKVPDCLDPFVCEFEGDREDVSNFVHGMSPVN